MGSGAADQGNTVSEMTLRAIDFITAGLLLTGRLQISGLYFSHEGLVIPLTGPLTGGAEIVGNTSSSTVVLGLLDALTALLLIIGQLDVIGSFVMSRRFAIAVSGPPLGFGKTTGYNPLATDFFKVYRSEILDSFQPKR